MYLWDITIVIRDHLVVERSYVSKGIPLPKDCAKSATTHMVAHLTKVALSSVWVPVEA